MPKQDRTAIWWRFLIIVLLVLGMFFRLVNLDRKVYWYDEAHTSLRISGYTKLEVIQYVFNSREIGVEDLHKYQHPNPEKSVIDTIKSLALEDPQHPPLYYVMLRYWVLICGYSIMAVRILSALISLFVFPCIYWLCLELFESRLVGWVAIALMSVSPFHVLYAQEAREYSLWTVTILLSSACLLRTLRLESNGTDRSRISRWGIYAATVTIGLYTFLFSGLVAIAHGSYVVVTEGFRLSKTVIAYLLASFVGIVAFIPWFWIVVSNSAQVSRTTTWSISKLPFLLGKNSLVQNWSLNITRNFFDLDFGTDSTLMYLCLPFVILALYSLYFLYRHTPKRVWLFIFTLTLGTALSLVLPDIILGGQISTMGRYLIPCHLGMQLAVAYLLANKITSISAKHWQQKLWQIVTLALISSGVLSCVVSSQAKVWWNKEQSYSLPAIASAIDKSIHPLVISNASMGNVMPLSYLLEPKVRLQLVNSSTIPLIPEGFSDVFLYKTSKQMQEQLEKNYHIEPINQKLNNLRRLRKKSLTIP